MYIDEQRLPGVDIVHVFGIGDAWSLADSPFGPDGTEHTIRITQVVPPPPTDFEVFQTGPDKVTMDWTKSTGYANVYEYRYRDIATLWSPWVAIWKSGRGEQHEDGLVDGIPDSQGGGNSNVEVSPVSERTLGRIFELRASIGEVYETNTGFYGGQPVSATIAAYYPWTPPGAVRNLSLALNAHGAGVFTFAAIFNYPTVLGAAPSYSLDYRVRKGDEAPGEWRPAASGGLGSRRCTDLTRICEGNLFDLGADDAPVIETGVQYTFEVRMVNEHGAGPGTTAQYTLAAEQQAEPEPEPLTAEFSGAPAQHDGSSFTFRLSFSEDVETDATRLRTQVLDVAGGAVTRAEPVTAGSSRSWDITVQPAGTGDVSVTLPVTTDCEAQSAVCTSDGRMLTTGLAHLVLGPPTSAPKAENRPATGAPAVSGTPQVGETLNASTAKIADPDGLDKAGFSFQWIRGSADIPRATGASYTLVSADEGERIQVRVSFTDDAGNAESLASAATEPIAAAPKPLTASFSDMPAEHTGDEFTFGLTLSEASVRSYRMLRDHAFDVSGGTVRRARRKQSGSNLGWNITVEPSGHGSVTIRLPETTDCGASGAICTDDGRPLSHSLSATVAGPVGITVSDASVDEAAGAKLAFAVTLSRAAGGTVTVDYATEDGSAQAGADYTATSGTLTFATGQSSQTVNVTVLDDSTTRARRR